MRKFPVAALMLILTLLAMPAAAATGDESWTSEKGLFRASYSSELDPLEINRIHSWTLHVETPDGEAVAGANIAVEGGMPAHNHGLPTAPRVTQYLGNGDYLIEGLRFHMMGYWELTVTISTETLNDTVVIPLEL